MYSFKKLKSAYQTLLFDGNNQQDFSLESEEQGLFLLACSLGDEPRVAT